MRDMPMRACIYGLCACAALAAQAAEPMRKSYACADGTTRSIAFADKHLAHIGPEGDTLSLWSLPYPVYRLELGDLNADGTPEIAVGVTKPTRYSPKNEKRLFIFKLYKGRLIRPLWMGSHVAATLDDFTIDNSTTPASIVTREHNAQGQRLQGLYHLGGFGLINDKIEPK